MKRNADSSKQDGAAAYMVNNSRAFLCNIFGNRMFNQLSFVACSFTRCDAVWLRMFQEEFMEAPQHTHTHTNTHTDRDKETEGP
jgi:hypothetical protein